MSSLDSALQWPAGEGSKTYVPPPQRLCDGGVKLHYGGSGQIIFWVGTLLQIDGGKEIKLVEGVGLKQSNDSGIPSADPPITYQPLLSLFSSLSPLYSTSLTKCPDPKRRLPILFTDPF